MRLGIRVSGHRSSAEAVRLAVTAEEAGFDEVWLTEDYLERGIYAVAGAIAAVTTRVTIGLGVVNPFTRHPGVIAMETAALDELADGRVVLALGASNERWMRDWLGIEYSRPLGAVREARQVITELLSNGAVDIDGDRFSVHARMSFTPDQRTPIWYGVKGSRGLQAARDDADGVVLSVLTSPAYVEWVRQIVGADVRLGAFVELATGPDGAAARDSLRAFVARFLGMHGDQPITRVAGLDPAVASQFRAATLAGTPDVTAVTEEILDAFVVAGDLDHCAAGLRRFADAGLDSLIVGDRPEEAGDRVVATTVSCWDAAGLART